MAESKLKNKSNIMYTLFDQERINELNRLDAEKRGKVKIAIDAIHVMMKKFKLTKDVAVTVIDEMNLTADEREKVLTAL